MNKKILLSKTIFSTLLLLLLVSFTFSNASASSCNEIVTDNLEEVFTPPFNDKEINAHPGEGNGEAYADANTQSGSFYANVANASTPLSYI